MNYYDKYPKKENTESKLKEVLQEAIDLSSDNTDEVKNEDNK